MNQTGIWRQLLEKLGRQIQEIQKTMLIPIQNVNSDIKLLSSFE